MSTNSQIMPREKGAAPLDVVIGVMAFLAALALGASLVANRTADTWRGGLAGKLTVQIVPPAQGLAQQGLQRETDAALAVLRTTPGIAYAAPLSQEEQLKLVQPWLGQGNLVADLPLPQLIDAEISPGSAVDLPGLAARLKQAAPDSFLDDHSHWISRLRDLAESVVWSAYGILLLIAIATAAAVSFATRAGLDAHHEMVALLHQMGAQSKFIARAFEWHYFRAALFAAAGGAGFAAIFFIAAGGLQFAGVEAVPFLPPMALKPFELPWLFAVPAVTSLIALATARLSVLAALRKIY
ncbi:MAG: cell division protein [Alphaproteobacteria bacterium]|nr:cell division protein [Alphaproteobacteria bacterium]MDE2500673.1 cell division protein [Alphaproteobacteria bacterium]